MGVRACRCRVCWFYSALFCSALLCSVRSKDSPHVRHQHSLVLKGLSVKFKGGHKIGIVGRTGAGKSSVVLAIFRMMELSGGGITIDGRDITSIPLDILRTRIAMIPQDPFVLSGSLRMNLSLGGVFSDEQLWDVL